MFYELTDHFVVAASPEQTWRFFSSAENLPKITPSWLGFRIDSPSPVRIENVSGALRVLAPPPQVVEGSPADASLIGLPDLEVQ